MRRSRVLGGAAPLRPKKGRETMTEPLEAETGRQRKILGSPAVKARMSLLSIAILLSGAFLAPSPARTALSSPQERAVPLLEEQVQTRAVEPFRGVQDTAIKVSGYSVAIVARRFQSVTTTNDFLTLPAQAPVTGFGVRISPSSVITHVAALDGLATISIAGDSGTTEATVAAYDPASGLTLLHLAPTELPPAPLATAAAVPGTLVVAGARLNGNTVTVPVFVTRSDPQRYSFSAIPAMLPGMPVYNLEGELIAISAGDREDGVAVPVTGAIDRLIARSTSQEAPGSFGLALQDLEASLAVVFGATGAVVTEVAHRGPADTAGITAGDVLLAVGDVECHTSAAAFAALTAVKPGEATTLRFGRAGRIHTVTAVAGTAYQVAAAALANGSSAGPSAQNVLPTSVREAAGIPPAAQVLLLNGRPIGSRDVAIRELARARESVPVLLRLDHRRFFVIIEAAQR